MNAPKPAVTALSPKREKAARLVALGGRDVEEIAAKVGVTRQSLWKWSKLPEFQARVREVEAELAAKAQARTVEAPAIEPVPFRPPRNGQVGIDQNGSSSQETHDVVIVGGPDRTLIAEQCRERARLIAEHEARIQQAIGGNRLSVFGSNG